MFASAYRYDVELYRYYLVASAVIAALAAAAVRLPLPPVRPSVVATAFSALLVLFAAGAWLANRELAAQLPFGGGQATIDAVVRDIPDGTIIVTSWYDAPTLGYGAAIEHALGSRTIVHGLPYQFVDAFPAWARQRHVVIFGWGTELQLDAVPPAWLKERPSGLPFYRIVEVVPQG
jgi:hypothetical protein